MIILNNVTRINILPQFGWLPDPEDTFNKDLPLSSTPMANGAMGTVAHEMDLTEFFKPISDQFQLPSCTANAVADAWEAMSVIDKVNGGVSLQSALETTPDFSRMFLWWCGRNEMSPNASLDATSGCYNRLIMDVMMRHGVPSEDLWPYDNAPVGPNGEPRAIVRPSIKAFRAAFVNACSAFYCIKQTGEERHNLIKQALGARHVVVFGTSLTAAFRTYTGGVIQKPALFSRSIGRHAMVIVGWSEEKQAYKVRNSWSQFWGEAGYCWLAKEYITSAITGGIWVATKGVL